jgi:hypothetical protein
MWMVWLLWGTTVIGGFYMAVGSVDAMMSHGFDPVLAVEAVIYAGCGAYGTPKLLRLVFGR